jgi:transcriptional regulator with XRE-family HTH domain
MKERLKEFMIHKAVSASELADKIGVQRSSISHILTGRNLPGSQFIEKLLNTYPELDAGWLITGKGKMLKAGENPMAVEETNNNGDELKITDPPPIMTNKTQPVKPTFFQEEIERIVFFYKDRSFSEYYPNPSDQTSHSRR